MRSQSENALLEEQRKVEIATAWQHSGSKVSVGRNATLHLHFFASKALR